MILFVMSVFLLFTVAHKLANVTFEVSGADPLRQSYSYNIECSFWCDFIVFSENIKYRYRCFDLSCVNSSCCHFLFLWAAIHLEGTYCSIPVWVQSGDTFCQVTLLWIISTCHFWIVNGFSCRTLWVTGSRCKVNMFFNKVLLCLMYLFLQTDVHSQ